MEIKELEIKSKGLQGKVFKGVYVILKNNAYQILVDKAKSLVLFCSKNDTDTFEVYDTYTANCEYIGENFVVLRDYVTSVFIKLEPNKIRVYKLKIIDFDEITSIGENDDIILARKAKTTYVVTEYMFKHADEPICSVSCDYIKNPSYNEETGLLKLNMSTMIRVKDGMVTEYTVRPLFNNMYETNRFIAKKAQSTDRKFAYCGSMNTVYEVYFADENLNRISEIFECIEEYNDRLMICFDKDGQFLVNNELKCLTPYGERYGEHEQISVSFMLLRLADYTNRVAIFSMYENKVIAYFSENCTFEDIHVQLGYTTKEAILATEPDGEKTILDCSRDSRIYRLKDINKYYKCFLREDNKDLMLLQDRYYDNGQDNLDTIENITKQMTAPLTPLSVIPPIPRSMVSQSIVEADTEEGTEADTEEDTEENNVPEEISGELAEIIREENMKETMASIGIGGFVGFDNIPIPSPIDPYFAVDKEGHFFSMNKLDDDAKNAKWHRVENKETIEEFFEQ